MAKGAERERQCTECGTTFTGLYRKCLACRPYRTDRLCASCGNAFHGETLNCATCQAPGRQCVTCGTTFTSRYKKCRDCRTTPGTCQFPGCGKPKVRGQGAKLCQAHREDADQRKLERLRKTDCYMPGCAEPKLTGTTPSGRHSPYRYCAQHSAEGPQREREQIVRRKRVREYGLTHEEFLALLETQGGVCAICGNGETAKGIRQLSVDHDHVTGQVRGLLCNRCNPMLGYARDDVTVLQAAIVYLEMAR